MRASIRRIVAAGGASALFVGCLFPSFDAASCNGGPIICNTGRPCKTGSCSNDELIGPPSVTVKICN